MNKSIITNLATVLIFLAGWSKAVAQGTAFTYQGRLNLNGVPVNRTYDLLFRPFNVPMGGTQLQIPNLRTVAITNGLFTTTLDFGSTIFNGDPLWLQIEISTNSFSGIVATLAPRQPLTPAPYAIVAASLVNGAVDTAQLASGAVTSAKVADGTLQPADLNLGSFSTAFWKVGGNAGTSTDFIGTTDDQPFDVRVNNTRVMRYRLTTDETGNFTNAPNVIGGSPINLALVNVVGATIAGGGGNESVDGTALINKVSANFGTIGGGGQNLSSALGATVGGGVDNTSSGNYATVAGGFINTAGGSIATVSGGYNNSAKGDYATVTGGYGNTAGGDYATVPGGRANAAAANHSFAAGNRAKAIHPGSFVWADSRDFDFPSVFGNGFFVRCDGATIATGIDNVGNVTAGVHLFRDATSWSSVSDRNAKKNFQPVNGEAVLEKLAALPVQSWNYKWESDTNTPHLGPMAQDFKAAFFPGRDDKSISTLEFDGVELAAIQGLNQKVEEQQAKLNQKQTEITELKQKNESLERRLDALEKIIRNQNSNLKETPP
jgi:trimeric autotransporter adhesin